jgi:preprotein translocase SecE subunit
MADSSDKRDAGKKAPAENSVVAQARRRAEQMASGGRKGVSPQQFFQEAWVELKKTTWPTREVLIKSTTVVMALVLAVAVWTGGLDYIFTHTLTPFFLGK